MRSFASCFSQNMAAKFVPRKSCDVLSKAQMVEFTNRGQLKVGGDCIQKNSKSNHLFYHPTIIFLYVFFYQLQLITEHHERASINIIPYSEA